MQLLLRNKIFIIIFSNFQETSTANTTTCFVSSNMAVFHQNQTTYSLVTMSTVANNHWKQYVSCWHIKSSIRRISFYCVAIMSVLRLIASMVSMMSASDGTTLNCGRRSLIVLIVYRQRQLLTRKYFVVMEVRKKVLFV